MNSRCNPPTKFVALLLRAEHPSTRSGRVARAERYLLWRAYIRQAADNRPEGPEALFPGYVQSEGP